MDELLEQGTYVAQQGEVGALIAMDEYRIEKAPNGYKIQSDNVVFGQNGFSQFAEMIVDDQWMMQDLHIVVNDKDIELNVTVEDRNVRIKQRQKQTEVTKEISLQFNQYFFLYSGALAIPLIWLRGFDFSFLEKMQYQVLPIGMAEVMQIKQENISDTRLFSLNIHIGEMSDFINIQTDQSGKVLLYESALSRLIIKPQLVC